VPGGNNQHQARQSHVLVECHLPSLTCPQVRIDLYKCPGSGHVKEKRDQYVYIIFNTEARKEG